MYNVQCTMYNFIKLRKFFSASLSSTLTSEIKALVPDYEVTIVIDHNYSA